MVKELTKPANNVSRPTLHLHLAFIHQKNVEAVEWAKIHLQLLDPLDNPLFMFDRYWFGLKKEQGTVDIWTNVFLVPERGDRLLDSMRTAVFENIKHI
ncbi:hypothetical protein EON65_50425 [archaeon]|nr:MAG: hypothetical protein EON65_50425 [archaeon]